MYLLYTDYWRTLWFRLSVVCVGCCVLLVIGWCTWCRTAVFNCCEFFLQIVIPPPDGRSLVYIHAILVWVRRYTYSLIHSVSTMMYVVCHHLVPHRVRNDQLGSSHCRSFTLLILCWGLAFFIIRSTSAHVFKQSIYSGISTFQISIIPFMIIVLLLCIAHW